MNIILILIGILPIVVIGYYIYKKDPYKEPKKLLLKLFLAGILSCFTVIIVSTLLGDSFVLFGTNPNLLSGVKKVIAVFIGIALLEELSKFLYLYLVSYNNKEFDYLFDMIVYSVYVSLGFALFENLLYISDGQISTGLLRAVTAVPFHACCGVFMGILLGKAKKYEKIDSKKSLFYKALSVVVPTLVHGSYNYSLYYNSKHAIIVFFIILTSTVVISTIFIDKKSQNDKKIL